jgi:hypothetical protein
VRTAAPKEDSRDTWHAVTGLPTLRRSVKWSRSTRKKEPATGLEVATVALCVILTGPGRHLTPEDHPDVVAEEINSLVASIR